MCKEGNGRNVQLIFQYLSELTRSGTILPAIRERSSYWSSQARRMSTTGRLCLRGRDYNCRSILVLWNPAATRFTDEFRVLQFPTPIGVYTCAPSFFVFHEEHAPAIHSRAAIEFLVYRGLYRR